MTSKFGWLQASATKNYCAPIGSDYPATIRIDKNEDRTCLSRREVAGSSPVAPANLLKIWFASVYQRFYPRGLSLELSASGGRLRPAIFLPKERC
jgi:hypothetical protein